MMVFDTSTSKQSTNKAVQGVGNAQHINQNFTAYLRFNVYPVFEAHY